MGVGLTLANRDLSDCYYYHKSVLVVAISIILEACEPTNFDSQNLMLLL